MNCPICGLVETDGFHHNDGMYIYCWRKEKTMKDCKLCGAKLSKFEAEKFVDECTDCVQAEDYAENDDEDFPEREDDV